MIVLDQDGHEWWVLKGDPAWGIIGRIRAPHVLPVETLRYGRVPHPGRALEHLQRLEKGYELTGDEVLREAFARAVALYDCLTEARDRAEEPGA